MSDGGDWRCTMLASRRLWLDDGDGRCHMYCIYQGKRGVGDGQATDRVQKVLETANIKLASVASDVLGTSGRDMLVALVAGISDADTLAELARGRLCKKLPALRCSQQDGRQSFRTHIVQAFPHLQDHLLHLEPIRALARRLPVLALQAAGIQQPEQALAMQAGDRLHVAQHPLLLRSRCCLVLRFHLLQILASFIHRHVFLCRHAFLGNILHEGIRGVEVLPTVEYSKYDYT